MNDGLDGQWIAAKLQEAAYEAARMGIFQTREKGIMPSKIRVSIWAMKDDGTYANTEYDTMILPDEYEAFYQAYKRDQVAKQTEISKDEAMNELHDIIDSLNDPEEGDDQGPDEAATGGPEQ